MKRKFWSEKSTLFFFFSWNWDGKNFMMKNLFMSYCIFYWIRLIFQKKKFLWFFCNLVWWWPNYLFLDLFRALTCSINTFFLLWFLAMWNKRKVCKKLLFFIKYLTLGNHESHNRPINSNQYDVCCKNYIFKVVFGLSWVRCVNMFEIIASVNSADSSENCRFCGFLYLQNFW
jgi:hypothetical protein